MHVEDKIEAEADTVGQTEAEPEAGAEAESEAEVDPGIGAEAGAKTMEGAGGEAGADLQMQIQIHTYIQFIEAPFPGRFSHNILRLINIQKECN